MDFEFAPVESLDKVPEQFRALYGQQAGEDGKFAVADSFKAVADSVNGFNKSNKTLRSQLKTSAVDLSPLAEFGGTPAEIAEAVKNALSEASTNKNGDVQKQIDAAKAGLLAGHTKELEKHTARNQALQTQLYGLMVENAATAAVAELKGIPELLMPFIKNQVKVVEENGEFKAQVVDGQGEVRYGSTGSPMTIKELVGEMKSQEKYGRLFESEQQPNRGGGGFQPGAGRTQNPGRQPAADRSANDKISQGLAARMRGGR
ncbi:virion-associated protein [Stenotrophomonas phage Sonora]|nr:virion-associated protein [Stenotrophomonas phage Sonora]